VNVFLVHAPRIVLDKGPLNGLLLLLLFWLLVFGLFMWS